MLHQYFTDLNIWTWWYFNINITSTYVEIGHTFE